MPTNWLEEMVTEVSLEEALDDADVEEDAEDDVLEDADDDVLEDADEDVEIVVLEDDGEEFAPVSIGHSHEPKSAKMPSRMSATSGQVQRERPWASGAGASCSESSG